MARRKRIVFSGQHLEIERIEQRRQDLEASVSAYFRIDNSGSAKRFLGYTVAEMRTEEESLIEESRRSASMEIFSALEAAFHIDFLQRCYRRERDEISMALRKLHDENQGASVPLDRILSAWRRHSIVPTNFVDHLKQAFRYRHWLAHGRYWRPNFPMLDYDEIYALAERALDEFPFKKT